MPIDSSIALGIRPPQLQQQDPLESYGKSLALQNLMRQGDIQQRGIDSDERIRALFSSNPNPTADQMMAIDPAKGMAYRKLIGDADLQRSTIDKNRAEVPKIQQEAISKAVATHRDQLSDVNDPQTAAQWVISGFKDPLLAPILSKGGDVNTALERLGKASQDPASFNTWKQQNALGATKFLEMNKPHISTVDTGGASNIVSTPGLGGTPSVIGSLLKTQSPDSMASNTLGRDTLAETKRHHAAIEGDPTTIENTAQAIAKGTLAPLSGFALGRPMGQAIMSRVTAINPDFDPTQFQVRQKAEKDFATGKQGNTVRSFNVALSHLDTLDQLSDALHNKDTQLINKIGNTVATQLGTAAPTNFEAAKKIVGDEIVKAIIGSGGGVTDREEAAKTISAASSPAQLKGVINTYKELMRGQIGGLRDQYASTTGKTDFDKRYLSESGRQASHATAAAPKPTRVDSLSQADPAKYAGQVATGDDGIKYKSDGKNWLRQP